MSFNKLKRFISIFLFFSGLLVFSIFSFAFVKKPFFLPVFSLFFLLWLFLLVNSFNLMLEKPEKILIGSLVILITFSGVFLADNLKDYSDKSKELIDLQNKISELAIQEAYASSYLDYFTKAIKMSDDNSLMLAQKINNLNITRSEPAYAVPDSPIILNYRDYEENDD